MIEWLERELVIAVHDQQLAEHGGGAGIRDDNMLESALARPQQLFSYGDPPPDLCALAASLTFGLARNHAFVDANKRTAILCCELFLALNDVELTATDLEIYPIILAVAEGLTLEAEFAEWLRSHTATGNFQVNEEAAEYKVAQKEKA